MDIINPEWLVLNFLPDRVKRQEEWAWQNMDTFHYGYPNSGFRYQRFLEVHFEEALRAFAQEQKKICAESAHFDDELLRDGCGLGRDYYEIDRESILEADFPEPINE